MTPDPEGVRPGGAGHTFTVETIWLRTFYVSFVIELQTRRVHLAA